MLIVENLRIINDLIRNKENFHFLNVNLLECLMFLYFFVISTNRYLFINTIVFNFKLVFSHESGKSSWGGRVNRGGGCPLCLSAGSSPDSDDLETIRWSVWWYIKYLNWTGNGCTGNLLDCTPLCFAHLSTLYTFLCANLTKRLSLHLWTLHTSLHCTLYSASRVCNF